MEDSKLYKVVIADDHLIVLNGIKRILECDSEIEIVACAQNGTLAYNACRDFQVDIVLLDLVMPLCDGIEAAKMIKSLDKDIKILILTSIPDSTKVIEAVKIGINGYILKDSAPEDLIFSVKNAVNGKKVFDKIIFDKLIDNMATLDVTHNLFVDLSETEYKVLDLIANGLENKEIADALFISPSTVRGVVSTLLLKYNVKNRTQLAIFATKNGLG
ncbi:response regulator transcription factor [Pseudobacteroides cellulosolvens]|uniref:Stage 0 sporulation protein A homolog n=1 Tax=Pseudobacteroides cellulosolvens ATCC 35603 = DSM 2933 TaxID=398512 RepID=A0A0L6JJQ9_9FIRM|nr:response regulator transcription factor [Pseudobacteroides cellulosolvens]KNY26116.1 two component transcriptional regulator, LuxR family [Pseudobacteroides cellulosolvens ATCC 35603 = DSM 2933]